MKAQCKRCSGHGQDWVKYCDLGCWGNCPHTGVKTCAGCSGKGYKIVRRKPKKGTKLIEMIEAEGKERVRK